MCTGGSFEVPRQTILEVDGSGPESMLTEIALLMKRYGAIITLVKISDKVKLELTGTKHFYRYQFRVRGLCQLNI